MVEIEKLLETWETEKGSYIPNAPIYGMFIKELKDAIERQKQINKLNIPVVSQQSEQLKALEELKDFAYDNCQPHNSDRLAEIVERL